jgi:hypothetical protein
VARAQEYARKYGWFVKLDVRRYFETLPHGPLLARLGTDIEDPRILALFEIILEMGANGPGRGIPIGALTSQHLGNYYLDRLDAWARDTARIPALVRYMDDILVFGETRADARVFRDSLSAFLHDDLELTVKHEVTVLGPTRIGIPFLGFRVHADRVRFDRARKRRWWENMREIDRRILVEGEDESLLVRRAGSLVGWAEQADTIGLRHSFLEHRARSPVAGYG